MKKILSVVLVLVAIGHVSANGIEPKSPLGMSVIKKGALVKLFYRGEQSGKVKITIYNEHGAVVFREVMQDTEHFMRPYNFRSLPDGQYKIELADESGRRYQTVTHKREPELVAHLTRLNKRENRYMLAVPNSGKDLITIRIYDGSDTMLLEDTQSIEGDFAKVYNLNAIGSLSTFEIVNGEGKVTRLSAR